MEETLKELLIPPDPNEEYTCVGTIRSKGFTLLMNLVLLTKKHFFLEDYLRKYVVENKDEVNNKNDKQFTALSLAIISNRFYSTIETVKILIDAGADVNSQDCLKCTPLIWAVRISDNILREIIVQMLIKAGADPNIKNDREKTVLMYICEQRFEHADYRVYIEYIIKILIDAGADLNLKDNEGMTALMLSCLTKDYRAENTIKLLIDAGADINILDNYGRTVLDYACNHVKNKCLENVVKLLVEADCDINLDQVIRIGERPKAVSTLLNDHLTNQIIKMYIKSNNYVNVLGKIPYYNNEFKFKYGTMCQKIVKYKFDIGMKPDSEIYNGIVKNDPNILDYLCINGAQQIYKLKEFVDFWNL